MKNHLYTRSYLTKRLREAGLVVKRLPIEYTPNDTRYWSILVNQTPNEQENIWVTCMRESLGDEAATFQMQSGLGKVKLETKSAEVVVEQIKQMCGPAPF